MSISRFFWQFSGIQTLGALSIAIAKASSPNLASDSELADLEQQDQGLLDLSNQLDFSGFFDNSLEFLWSSSFWCNIQCNSRTPPPDDSELGDPEQQGGSKDQHQWGNLALNLRQFCQFLWPLTFNLDLNFSVYIELSPTTSFKNRVVNLAGFTKCTFQTWFCENCERPADEILGDWDFMRS